MKQKACKFICKHWYLHIANGEMQQIIGWYAQSCSVLVLWLRWNWDNSTRKFSWLDYWPMPGCAFFVGTCFKYTHRKHTVLYEKKSVWYHNYILLWNYLVSEYSQVLLYVDINKYFNKCFLKCIELYLFCCNHCIHPLNSTAFSEDTDNVKRVLQHAELDP